MVYTPGSSPRMWGTQREGQVYLPGVRFIPTHVGNSQVPDSRRSSSIGSSPRMWGTHHLFQCDFFQDRFIPTHVGNSDPPGSRAWQGSVHPHACGELYEPPRINREYSGSSPRMWGTPGRSAEGNALSGSSPRMWGTPERSSTWNSRSGSSPRMWGTLVVYSLDQGMYRFIPTHVGNSLESTCPKNIVTVHPHACGELTTLSTITRRLIGSSPRMWGTRSVKNSEQ